MDNRARTKNATAALALALAALLAGAVRSDQKQDKNGIQSAIGILHQVRDSIKANYYDPKLNGFDIDAAFAKAETTISSKNTLSEGLFVIGRTVQELKDSHTNFFPPVRNVILDAGWTVVPVGDSCLITAVEPGSDASRNGLKPGDQLLKIDTAEINRSNFQSLMYLFNSLAPQSDFKLAVASPSQPARLVETKSREIVVPPQMTGGDASHLVRRYNEGIGHLIKPREVELSSDVLMWKLPMFFQREEDIHRITDAARKHKTLIVDLRDNGGGALEVLDWLVGGVFTHDVNVGERLERAGPKPYKITSRGDKAFSGNLIVLVNAGSGSASEIFAKTVQVEKRGVVIGDHTAGDVGWAKFFPNQVLGYHYDVEITIARLRFPDGVDLEGVGVTPDTKILPTAEDIAASRDPVLAAAAKQAGVELTPEAAGKLFPPVWATY
jgi:C-terminal processing protease CtpA/Prc